MERILIVSRVYLYVLYVFHARIDEFFIIKAAMDN